MATTILCIYIYIYIYIQILEMCPKPPNPLAPPEMGHQAARGMDWPLLEDLQSSYVQLSAYWSWYLPLTVSRVAIWVNWYMAHRECVNHHLTLLSQPGPPFENEWFSDLLPRSQKSEKVSPRYPKRHQQVNWISSSSQNMWTSETSSKSLHL